MQGHWIEITGVVFGILCVLFGILHKIWTWPMGIISVLCYFIFYTELNLYSSALLHIIYLLLSFHGWYQWKNYGIEKKNKIVYLIPKGLMSKHLMGIVIGTFVLGYFFSHFFSDAKLPYIDAFIATSSISAQIMMNYKILQSWLMWFISDFAYLIMHLYREDFPSVFLFSAYLIFSIIGFITWYRSYKNLSLNEKA